MGDEEKTQGRRLEEERAVEGERAVREGGERVRAGWGLWLPLLTAIDFL